jgi:hypothetical protein
MEPTDDKILVKAKQLARDDGRLWLWTSEEGQPREAWSRCRRFASGRISKSCPRAAAAREDLNALYCGESTPGLMPNSTMPGPAARAQLTGPLTPAPGC